MHDPKFSFMQPSLLVLTLLLFIQASPVRSNTNSDNLCETALRNAAVKYSVPIGILTSIAYVESGFTHQGEFKPWPWTVNYDGKGYFLKDEEAALNFLRQKSQSGEKNFDVGCFQINYMWHGENFSSLNDVIRPEINASYAAQFLKSLHEEFGSWQEAVKAFHSRTETLSSEYLLRVSNMADNLSISIEQGSNHTKVIPIIAYSLKPKRPNSLGSLFTPKSEK